MYTGISIKRKSMKEKTHYSEQEDSPADCSSFALHTPISTVRSPCSFNMNDRGGYLSFDQESEPDRSNPNWKVSRKVSEEKVVEETRKEPILQPTVWEKIMEEYENERKLLRELNKERQVYEPDLPRGPKLTAVQYLQDNIFPVLCPALEDTLFQAKKEDCLQIQKCVFNGLDNISELLWNRNPLHPRRKNRRHRNIFEIPFVKIWLYHNPRPIYPLSWVWTEEEAITVLQAYIRRYFVCREPDCCEMRKFWQVFKQEKRAEERMRELEHTQQVKEIIGEIMLEIIALAVYRSEWSVRGCFCISKPCNCECKCFKWCKCCRCYKQEKSIADRFYSGGSTLNNIKR